MKYLLDKLTEYYKYIARAYLLFFLFYLGYLICSLHIILNLEMDKFLNVMANLFIHLGILLALAFLRIYLDYRQNKLYQKYLEKYNFSVN